MLADHLANSSFCTGDKPETVQICNDKPCPAKWIVGNWSEVGNQQVYYFVVVVVAAVAHVENVIV